MFAVASELDVLENVEGAHKLAELGMQSAFTPKKRDYRSVSRQLFNDFVEQVSVHVADLHVGFVSWTFRATFKAVVSEL